MCTKLYINMQQFYEKYDVSISVLLRQEKWVKMEWILFGVDPYRLTLSLDFAFFFFFFFFFENEQLLYDVTSTKSFQKIRVTYHYSKPHPSIKNDYKF